jgi:replicative DNA helicase
MSLTTLPTTHPPTAPDLQRLVEIVDEHELDRQLRRALTRVRTLRRARRARTAARARRDHALLTERALLASGLVHLG